MQQKAVAIAEKDPEFKEIVEADKRRALAKELAEQGVAANSNNRNLTALAVIPKGIGKHMKKTPASRKV